MPRTRGSKILGLLLSLCASSAIATPSRLEVSSLLAQAPGAAPSEVVRSVPAIMESTRAKVLAALARGDIAGAITAYEVHVGRRAPEWLRALHLAYNTKSQEVGKCQEVARVIHSAYSQLGKTPEFIVLRTSHQAPYMTFDMPGGRAVSITRNGFHVAVKLGDHVHDAFTGPLGMKLEDYLSRLHALERITWEVATHP